MSLSHTLSDLYNADTVSHFMPFIDLSFGLSQLNGDPFLQVALLRKFANEYRTLEKRLEQKFQHCQYQEAIKDLHTLKGVCSNLGCTQLYQQCLQMETALKAVNQRPEAFSGFILALEGTLEEIDRLSPP